MKKVYFMAPALMALVCACSPKSNGSAVSTSTSTSTSTTTTTVTNGNGGTETATPEPVPMPGNEMNSRPHLARAKATLFKMSGDYANNVAVTLGADGNLLYFPAPTDITPESAPVEVGDGWWLNRQGIGENSVFTKYTFEEYSALKTVPTVEELKAAIIPGARVTEYRILAIPAAEAKKLKPADLLKML